MKALSLAFLAVPILMASSPPDACGCGAVKLNTVDGSVIQVTEPTIEGHGCQCAFCGACDDPRGCDVDGTFRIRTNNTSWFYPVRFHPFGSPSGTWVEVGFGGVPVPQFTDYVVKFDDVHWSCGYYSQDFDNFQAWDGSGWVSVAGIVRFGCGSCASVPD